MDDVNVLRGSPSRMRRLRSDFVSATTVDALRQEWSGGWTEGGGGGGAGE